MYSLHSIYPPTAAANVGSLGGGFGQIQATSALSSSSNLKAQDHTGHLKDSSPQLKRWDRPRPLPQKLKWLLPSDADDVNFTEQPPKKLGVICLDRGALTIQMKSDNQLLNKPMRSKYSKVRSENGSGNVTIREACLAVKEVNPLKLADWIRQREILVSSSRQGSWESFEESDYDLGIEILSTGGGTYNLSRSMLAAQAASATSGNVFSSDGMTVERIVRLLDDRTGSIEIPSNHSDDRAESSEAVSISPDTSKLSCSPVSLFTAIMASTYKSVLQQSVDMADHSASADACSSEALLFVMPTYLPTHTKFDIFKSVDAAGISVQRSAGCATALVAYHLSTEDAAACFLHNFGALRCMVVEMHDDCITVSIVSVDSALRTCLADECTDVIYNEDETDKYFRCVQSTVEGDGRKAAAQHSLDVNYDTLDDMFPTADEANCADYTKKESQEKHSFTCRLHNKSAFSFHQHVPDEALSPKHSPQRELISPTLDFEDQAPDHGNAAFRRNDLINQLHDDSPSSAYSLSGNCGEQSPHDSARPSEYANAVVELENLAKPTNSSLNEIGKSSITNDQLDFQQQWETQSNVTAPSFAQSLMRSVPSVNKHGIKSIRHQLEDVEMPVSHSVCITIESCAHCYINEDCVHTEDSELGCDSQDLQYDNESDSDDYLAEFDDIHEETLVTKKLRALIKKVLYHQTLLYGKQSHPSYKSDVFQAATCGRAALSSTIDGTHIPLLDNVLFWSGRFEDRTTDKISNNNRKRTGHLKGQNEPFAPNPVPLDNYQSKYVYSAGECCEAIHQEVKSVLRSNEHYVMDYGHEDDDASSVGGDSAIDACNSSCINSMLSFGTAGTRVQDAAHISRQLMLPFKALSEGSMILCETFLPKDYSCPLRIFDTSSVVDNDYNTSDKLQLPQKFPHSSAYGIVLKYVDESELVSPLSFPIFADDDVFWFSDTNESTKNSCDSKLKRFLFSEGGICDDNGKSIINVKEAESYRYIAPRFDNLIELSLRNKIIPDCARAYHLGGQCVDVFNVEKLAGYCHVNAFGIISLLHWFETIFWKSGTATTHVPEVCEAGIVYDVIYEKESHGNQINVEIRQDTSTQKKPSNNGHWVILLVEKLEASSQQFTSVSQSEFSPSDAVNSTVHCNDTNFDKFVVEGTNPSTTSSKYTKIITALPIPDGCADGISNDTSMLQHQCTFPNCLLTFVPTERSLCSVPTLHLQLCKRENSSEDGMIARTCEDFSDSPRFLTVWNMPCSKPSFLRRLFSVLPNGIQKVISVKSVTMQQYYNDSLASSPFYSRYFSKVFLIMLILIIAFFLKYNISGTRSTLSIGKNYIDTKNIHENQSELLSMSSFKSTFELDQLSSEGNVGHAINESSEKQRVAQITPNEEITASNALMKQTIEDSVVSKHTVTTHTNVIQKIKGTTSITIKKAKLVVNKILSFFQNILVDGIISFVDRFKNGLTAMVSKIKNK